MHQLVGLFRLACKSSLLYCMLLFMMLSSSSFVTAQQTARDTSQVWSLLLLGDAQLAKDNLDSAGVYYQQAGSLAKEIDFKKGYAKFVQYYIKVLNRQGKYEEALPLVLESLEISKSLGKAEQSIAYNNVGNVYRYLGNMEAAATNFMKALQLSEAIGHKAFQRMHTNNLASVFLDLREIDKAYEYAYSSYQLALQIKDTAGIASSLVNLANSETLKKNYANSTRYFKEVIKMGQALNDPSYVMDAYINLADIEVQQEKYQGSLSYYQQALQVLHYYPAADYEVYIFWGLAQSYYFLKMYPEADHYLQKSITVAKSISSYNELRQLYKLGADIHEKMNDPKLALSYIKNYEALNDSLMNAETRENIHRLEIEYQTSQKEKEIAQQNLLIANSKLEIHKKTNFIYLSVALAIIFFFGIIIFYILYQNKQKANAEKLRALAKENEIKMLMAMVEGEEKERARLARELHDGVGGILSATKMHLSILKNEEQLTDRSAKFNHTASMLDSASQEIRNISHNLSPGMLLENELETVLASFCQKVSNASLQVDFYHLGDSVKLKNNFKLVLYRIVQELVNNIIKHAQASHALVQLSQHEQVLSLTVEDDGVGFDASEKGHGIGLGNLQSRVADMGGQISIETAKGRGTTVYLEFDVSLYMEKPMLVTTAVV